MTKKWKGTQKYSERETAKSATDFQTSIDNINNGRLTLLFQP